jgi:hypothetical protein
MTEQTPEEHWEPYFGDEEVKDTLQQAALGD